jgi:hypothetical protein
MQINNNFHASNSPETVSEDGVRNSPRSSQDSAQSVGSGIQQVLHDASEIVDHVISAVTGQNSIGGGAQGIKNALDNRDKDLQNQDKLGSFEIQSLMSEFNEAQTLASSVLKKKDDTGNAVIQKI